MSTAKDPIFTTCSACGEKVDVSSCTPFADLACPSCGGEMSARRTFQHYEIEVEIGRGGMSRVYRAKDPSLDRQVALKVLRDRFHQDDERVRQFEKEAHITASFTHPNVVKVYGVGREHQNLVIVMELVENGSLEDLIARQGKISEQQTLVWGLEMAHGLQAAYQNGLIHRDVKPGNILLAQDRSAKLVDFGLALMFQREVDESEEIWATPYYVPLEKLMGEGEDHRSDIYSLGATLYHLLAGKPSFEVITGSHEELREAKMKRVDVRDVVPHVSPRTARAIQQMMKPDPSERPDTYDELITLLDDAKGTSKSGRRTAAGKAAPSLGSAGQRFLATQKARQSARRRRQTAFARIALMGSFLAIAWLIYQSQTKERANASKLGADPPTAPLDDETPITVGDAADADAVFAQARLSLAEAKWELAGTRFQELSERRDISPSLHQWALFHGGLTQLFEGREPASRETFRLLGDLEGNRPELDAVFDQASAHLLQDQSIPEQNAQDTSPGFCHGIFLLAYGLKNWELEAFAEAKAHLQNFHLSSPSTEFQWITAYRPLIDDHLADLEWLAERRPIHAFSEKSALTTERQTLRRLAKSARTQKARAVVNRHLAAARVRLANWDKESANRRADRAKRERAVWQGLRQDLQPLASAMRFEQGTTLLQATAAKVESEIGQTHLSDHQHLWDLAARFVNHVFQNAEELRLKRRDGKTVSGTTISADRETLVLRTPGGTVTLPLEDLAAESLVAEAKDQLDATRDANVYYQRLEELVGFAYVTGLENITKNHVRILTQENRPFRARWNRVQAPENPFKPAHYPNG